jgi:hypothetical protein
LLMIPFEVWEPTPLPGVSALKRQRVRSNGYAVRVLQSASG